MTWGHALTSYLPCHALPLPCPSVPILWSLLSVFRLSAYLSLSACMYFCLCLCLSVCLSLSLSDSLSLSLSCACVHITERPTGTSLPLVLPMPSVWTFTNWDVPEKNLQPRYAVVESATSWRRAYDDRFTSVGCYQSWQQQMVEISNRWRQRGTECCLDLLNLSADLNRQRYQTHYYLHRVGYHLDDLIDDLLADLKGSSDKWQFCVGCTRSKQSRRFMLILRSHNLKNTHFGDEVLCIMYDVVTTWRHLKDWLVSRWRHFNDWFVTIWRHFNDHCRQVSPLQRICLLGLKFVSPLICWHVAEVHDL